MIVDEWRESNPGTFMYSILNVCGFTIENSPRDHERVASWRGNRGDIVVEHRSLAGIIRHGEKERDERTWFRWNGKERERE